MMHESYKQKKSSRRFVFFAETPKLSASELESVNKMKEEEGGELDTAGLVNEVNSSIAAHSSQIDQLPPAFGQALRREILQYLTASPGRFEKDEKKGLSAKEFAAYRASVVGKVKELLEQHVPTEEQIKKRKESREKAVEAGKSAEKIEPLDMKKLQESPGEIKDVGVLNEKFQEYNGWNASLQKEGGEVLESTSSFQGSCANYVMSRNGLKSYKKFQAYLWPEDDQERINLQNKLSAAKQKVRETISKYNEAQEKLKKYGKELGEVSNRLKQDKIKERDERIQKIESGEEKRSGKQTEKQEAYNSLEKRQKALIEERERLEKYQENTEKSKDVVENRLENAKNKKGQLEQFDSTVKSASQKIEEAMKNPNLSDAAREHLEKQKAILDKKSTEAGSGLKAAGMVIDNQGKEAARLEGEEEKMAAQSLNLQTHLDNQVHPSLLSLHSSIALLEQAKLEFATSKDQIIQHYDQAFQYYDEMDAAVDGAVASNNLAHEKMVGFLQNQEKALNKINLAPPSGFTGAFEATIGIIPATAGGALTWAGEGIVAQAAWLSRELEGARAEMGKFTYAAARLGVEIVSVPIGVAGGLVELGGGLLQMVAHPIDTVKGMAPLVGLSDEVSAGEAWTEMGKALIAWEDFKEGRIGLGIGRTFTNIVATITGAGAVGAGGKAAATAFKAARAAGKGVAISTAKAGATFAVEAGSFVAKELRAGGVEAALKAARAPGKAKELAVYAASKMERLWKGTSAKSLQMRQLGQAIEKGAPRYELFQQALEKLRKEHPDLNDEALRAKLRHEEPKLHADGAAFESNFRKFQQGVEEAEPIPLVKKKAAAGEEEKAIPLTKKKAPKEKPVPLVRRKAKPVTEKAPQMKESASPVAEVAAAAKEDMAASIIKLQDRFKKEPQLRARVATVLKKNGLSPKHLNSLDAGELRLLAQTESPLLTEVVIEKVIKREFTVLEDVVSGQPLKVRVYMNDSVKLGSGGFGEVKEGFFAIWETGGRTVENVRLKKGAVKKQQPSSVAAKNMAENEIATLRAVRDLPPDRQTHLLKPEFIGRVGNEIIIVTDKIDPYPGAKGVRLKETLAAAPIDEALQFLSDATHGLDELHAMGRMHMDVKLENIFAGSVNGKRTAVMGDLASVKIEEITSMRFEKFNHPEMGEITIVFKKLPDGTEYQIPSTPTAMMHARMHFRAAQEWLLANPGKPIPPYVRSLPDMGQLSFTIRRISENLRKRKAPEKIVSRLENLFNQIDNQIPDFDRLNAEIKRATAASDTEALEVAKATKQAALDRLESTMTPKDLRKELNKIIDEIKSEDVTLLKSEEILMPDDVTSFTVTKKPGSDEAPTAKTKGPPSAEPPTAPQ